MTTAVVPKPGITFETWRAPLPTPLPRMDVAAFVGFAASGPLDVPVPVESINEFHEIFGEDLVLGIERNGNAVVYAELPPAVRQFFRAGGRRCWVVRVAANPTANRFPVPGILANAADSPATAPRAAHLIARSPGSWSDALLVNCTLRTRAIQVQWSPATAGDAPKIAVAPAAGGDLLMVMPAARRSLVGFLAVPVRPRAAKRGAAAAPVTVGLDGATWFRREAQAVTTGWRSCDAVLLTIAPDGAPVEVELPFARMRRMPGTLIVESRGPLPPLLRPGAWVRLKRRPANPAAPSIERYAMVAQVTERARPHARLVVESVDFWRRVSREDALNAVRRSRQIRADVVTVDLTLRRGHSDERLEDLGLVDGHPRYLGDIPDDATWYGARHDQVATTSAVSSAARPTRFSLASPYPGPRELADIEPTRPAELLPLGVLGLPRIEWFQGRIATTDSVLERDGVATFEASLFLEAGLANEPAASLLERAFQIQYPDRTGASPVALRGMHALLDVAEPSMIAVPDAVHRPALPRLPLRGWLGAPRNVRVRVSGDGHAEVDWDAPRGATSARIERSLDPLFTTDVTVLPQPAFVFDPLAAPQRFFFRVQPRDDSGRLGRWSETVWVTLPNRVFLTCVDDQPSAPVLELRDAGDTLELQWTQPAGAVADTFQLQASQEPSFTAPTQLYRGPSQSFNVWDLATPVSGLRETGRLGDQASIPDLFFRVSATVGARSTPWSNTVRHRGVVAGSPRRRSMAAVSSATPELVAIHAALVRLCAARGDIHAILSMPMTWHAAEINDHLAALAAELQRPREASGGFAASDEDQLDRILSFGAAWHPWPIVRETTDASPDAFFATAPDGLIAGTIAARTIAGGAWLDPANQLLPGVLQLTPELTGDEIGSLSPHLNLLRQIPRGHTTLSSRTLANGRQLVELGVRRLMILVRRLAVREGAAYAFLPHDAMLRRLVQREFEGVLGDLFARGALAGREPEDAYRVVVDSTVNPARDVEAGRLVVELWIAPSHPLVFLKIRLVQEGEELLAAQEA